MPWWRPFIKRRSGFKEGGGRDALADQKAMAPSTETSSPAVPRQSSTRSQRSQCASAQQQPQEKMAEAQSPTAKKDIPPVPPLAQQPSRSSVEDGLTALPVSRRLQHSPHLRPADVGRPPIPYNFRPHSSSQTSIQREDVKVTRPQRLRSRRSGTPSRRSTKKSRKDEQLREEEIRSLSAPIPIPKRAGDSGPLRRDSKKWRGMRDSYITLPPEESIHSSMSGVMEQRGWEVGSLFTPRPAVRLSGTPQYVAPSSVLNTSYMSRASPKKEKDMAAVTKGSVRKRQTIGEQVDDFDASDLRLLLERDAKRRAQKAKERQEKLDQRLKARQGRNRGDSDRRRREAEEQRRADEAKRRADGRAQDQQREMELARQRFLTPPTDVHPALRDKPAVTGNGGLGLDVGAGEATVHLDPEQEHAHAVPTTEEQGTQNAGTDLEYPRRGDIPTNPFADTEALPTPEPEAERMLSVPRAFTPLETPLEDPIVHTAQAVSISQTQTPPLLPVRIEQTKQTDRRPSISSESANVRTSDLPPPPPIPADLRTSEPREGRAGAWASFFRRGGTTPKKRDDGRSTASEMSFSNTSRDSTRNQPLPPHLVATQQPAQRRKGSGTPVRTHSRFREELGIPISPPASSMPPPDTTKMAATVTPARRVKKASRQPVDISGSVSETPDAAYITRNDTPISPSTGGHGLMSASLASVDSEGSWLASSGKRQSTHSVISRGIGSLSKRKPEFTASYEELGGDKDAEYFHRGSPPNRAGSSALAGAAPDEEGEYGGGFDAPILGDPLTVHESVRRKPTLVHRDPRLKSREALMTEYRAEPETVEPEEYPEQWGIDPDSPETEVRSARSVDFGKRHARQFSAGSVKLLDTTSSRRASRADMGSPASPATSVPLSALRTSRI